MQRRFEGLEVVRQGRSFVWRRTGEQLGECGGLLRHQAEQLRLGLAELLEKRAQQLRIGLHLGAHLRQRLRPDERVQLPQQNRRRRSACSTRRARET